MEILMKIFGSSIDVYLSRENDLQRFTKNDGNVGIVKLKIVW